MKRLSFAAAFAASFILLTSANPSFAIGIDTASSPLADTIANSARGVAGSMGSVGYCFRGVKRALKRVGFVLTGSEAYMAKQQLAEHPQFEEVELDDLQIGDILVHGASRRHPHGHIAVYLGDNKEASDHVGKLITGARYGGTTVWRVKPEIALEPADSLDHSYDVEADAAQETTPNENDEVATTDVEAAPEPTQEVAMATETAPDAAPQTPIADEVIQAPSLVNNTPQHVLLANNFSSAMIQVMQLAQSAQISFTQAIANAFSAFGS